MTAQFNPLDIEPTLHAAMIDARRHLHAHPELSNEERETQAFILRWLTEQGVGKAREAAGTGAVIDIVGQAGLSNRKIAIRADIDALPISEKSGVSFSSTRPGVMHACGHDAHTAMGLATAALLHRARSRFSGTVRLIFQPAEEAEPLGGRRIVMDDRLLEDVDAAIGIHVDPYLQTGKLGASSGAFTLASDIFDIVIKGRSAHAARPNEGVDAIAVSAAVVAEVQKIVSRESDPFGALIISITGISGGGAYNVIADRVELRGTIRSDRTETRERAHRRLKAIVAGVAACHGAEADVDITTGEPSVQNDAAMVQLIQSVAPQAFVSLPGWSAADDFGFFSQAVPSVYFRLGIRDEEVGSVHPLHHPEFRVDERALGLGVTTLATAALRFLERA